MILLVHSNTQTPHKTIQWLWDMLKSKDTVVLLDCPLSHGSDPYARLIDMFPNRVKHLAPCVGNTYHWLEALDLSWQWDCLVEVPQNTLPSRSNLEALTTALEIAEVAVARPSSQTPRNLRHSLYRTWGTHVVPKILNLQMPPVFSSLRAWRRELICDVIQNVTPTTKGPLFKIGTIVSALALGAGVISVPLTENFQEPSTFIAAWEETVALWKLRHRIRKLPMIHHVPISKFHHV